MKKILLAGMILFLFSGLNFAQEEVTPEIKEEKKIIIKIMDEDGKVTTEVIEGEDALDATESIWISEKGDSMQIEVEIEDNDGMKVIKKKIVIPGLDDIDFEEIGNNIEIFELDEDFGPGHIRFFGKDGFEAFNPGMLKKHMLFLEDNLENKARLGVHIEDAKNGVKVTEVVPNSTAYAIGILAGDVITRIDGKKMTNTEELIREVGNHKPGDMIEIKLKRNGKSKKFTGKLQGGNDLQKMIIGSGKLDQMFGPDFRENMNRVKHHCFRAGEECEKICDHIEKEVQSEMKKHKKQMKMFKKQHKEQMKKEMEHMKKEMKHKEMQQRKMEELDKSEEDEQ